MKIDTTELLEQLAYEVSEQAQYGLEKPIELTTEETFEIANLIINKDKEIESLFEMDPAICIIHMDDEDYDWSEYYRQITDVISWHKMNPLTKMFMSKN